MEKENYQMLIYDFLHQRPIAYNAGLAHALGSVKAGVLIGQLLFWQGKGKNQDWTYKTIEEMRDETALSKAEQNSAIKRCKQLGILKMEVHGLPPKRHFHVDINKLIELLDSKSSKSGKTIFRKPDTQSSKTRTSSITENTSEKTTEKENSYSKQKSMGRFIRGGVKQLSEEKSVRNL